MLNGRHDGRKGRGAVALVFLALVGCQPPSASTYVIGPSLELSSAHATASFSVRLCIDAPTFDYTDPIAQVEAYVTDTDDPSARLDVRTEIDHGDVIDEDTTTTDLIVRLDREGPWRGPSGWRCGALQTVHLTASGLDDDETMAIEWGVMFEMEWDDGWRGNELHESDLYVEIESLPLKSE